MIINSGLLTYAAYNKNIDIRLRSSSGGIFYALAERIILNNGVVYGVTMSADIKRAIYIGVKSIEEISLLMGSKYLQADTGNIFFDIKNDLEKKKLVLFSGVACHINGLQKYLNKQYDNLLCIDIICHGTPSPLVWNKYVQYIEKKYGLPMTDVKFRCKDNGWSNYGVCETMGRKLKRYVSRNSNPYMILFQKNYSLRPSCFECQVKKNKLSDITIGDFWGVDNVVPEMNDDNGVSVVIIRTKKGLKFWQNILINVNYKEVAYSESIVCNPAECMSVKRPENRNQFFQDLIALDFDKIVKIYGKTIKTSLVTSFKIFIKKILNFITYKM